MSRDRSGNELKVGDKVLIMAEVVDVLGGTSARFRDLDEDGGPQHNRSFVCDTRLTERIPPEVLTAEAGRIAPYEVSTVVRDDHAYGGVVATLDQVVPFTPEGKPQWVPWGMTIRTTDPAITHALAVGAVVTLEIKAPAGG